MNNYFLFSITSTFLGPTTAIQEELSDKAIHFNANAIKDMHS